MFNQSSSVSLIYVVEIAKTPQNVDVTWSKTTSSHSLTIKIENVKDEQQNHHQPVKIDLSGSSFWAKKGLKSLEANGTRVDVYWDFRQAKFSNFPEPSSGFYVSLVSQNATVLTIGDLRNEALKRTKKNPSATEAALVSKQEHVHGKRVFYTRTAFGGGESRRENEVVIETSLSGPSDPEMWITVDGVPAIRIMNLNWRFRGNEVVTVSDGVSLEIFWDVHDWLFEPSGSSSGLFVFKPKAGFESKCLSFNGGYGDGEGEDHDVEDDDSSPKYCHVLYAVKELEFPCQKN
ncbi:unnamed protein product [Arabidopsis thaliana]|uniref:Kinesin-like protein (DUF868) n=1 Tax=Arabidopsis thaliana TaxID=3702 RepID=Q9LTU7_ARATH|nr:kinesin-like protein (DUF868) [Arabidopsis thaliana]AAT68366.1 hypothetical protein At3g13229 [Arabidopsis thaliana]AAV63905.1 hypothetical protein At3g13229 [Arabidopsis thaliana]AEE75321.1 kinesin-like protein (DUF868) [Arabidopsis thaliana]BAB02790.1 unnamed protein product [Arabidopsis thaliana]|eukprot:NP_683561.1 kinesin-like protein (DUF868) [Arabidopsis thaliana]